MNFHSLLIFYAYLAICTVKLVEPTHSVRTNISMGDDTVILPYLTAKIASDSFASEILLALNQMATTDRR